MLLPIDCVPLLLCMVRMLAFAVFLMFSEIERLPKSKFLSVRNLEKVNGEMRETHGEIMTQLGLGSPTERVLSSDEARSCKLKHNSNQFLKTGDHWLKKIKKLLARICTRVCVKKICSVVSRLNRGLVASLHDL